MRLSPDPDTPTPLVVAACLAAVQGLFLIGYAVLETASVSSGRVTMGLTTAAFFLIAGVALVWGAWAVTHGRGVARGPILLVQLIQLGLAYNFLTSGTLVVAVVLAVVAVVVILGFLAPASLAALDPDRR
ncbi:conserved membrane hypothetical protein [metagenome]|uniref:Uncharacterized protein n=1 Tax=metagenome TaxID=256318 RepID=A0A2P2C1K3_9ZZZZ